MSSILPTEGAQSAAEAALLAQLARNGVGAIPPALVEGSVYMGAASKDRVDNFGFTESKTGPIPDWLMKPDTFQSVEMASQAFWKFTPEQDKRLSAIMEADTGYAPKSMESKKAYWENLVKLTASYTAATGDKYLSPWDMGGKIVAQSSGGRRAGGGPSVSFYETEQVNLTNPSTARRVMDNAIGQYLGRSPDKKEYNEFLRTLNGFEEDSPTVTKGVTRNSGGSASTSKTEQSTKGGVDTTQVAKEFAMRDEQYQETTMETKGIDTFLNMLRG